MIKPNTKTKDGSCKRLKNIWSQVWKNIIFSKSLFLDWQLLVLFENISPTSN